MTEGPKQYARRDPAALDRDGGYFCRHLSAMTGERLHDKADIAAELAWRDREIDRLKARLGLVCTALLFLDMGEAKL